MRRGSGEIPPGVFTWGYRHRAVVGEDSSGVEPSEPEGDRFNPARRPPRPLSSGQTEAQVVVPVLRRVPVPVRRPRVLRVVVPAPAPDHPVRGRSGSPTGIESTT